MSFGKILRDLPLVWAATDILSLELRVDPLGIVDQTGPYRGVEGGTKSAAL